MKLSSRFETANAHLFTSLKAPGVDAPEAQRDPAVAATVSAMLLEIERDGFDAIRRYARELDKSDVGTDGSFELTATDLAATGGLLATDLRESIELGSARTKQFAALQREHLTDFEAELVPGLITGQRYVPVGTVGAYLPAGRFQIGRAHV